ILYVHHQFEEGLAEARLGTELAPANPLMHATLGALLRGLGRREDAIAEYRRAIALDPREAVYHAVLGAMLSESAQRDEAIAELQKAQELEPKLPDTLYNNAKSLLDKVPHITSADLANADTQDACWLISIARQLAPADAPKTASNQTLELCSNP